MMDASVETTHTLVVKAIPAALVSEVLVCLSSPVFRKNRHRPSATDTSLFRASLTFLVPLLSLLPQHHE